MTRRLLLRASGVALLLAGWQVATLLAADPARWPTFDAIAIRTWTAWITEPSAWIDAVLPSLARLAAGWLVAVGLGVALGLLIGRSGAARDILLPIVHFGRAIPPPVVVPLLLVLLGIGDAMKVALIAFGCIWPVLLNTVDGVSDVDPLHAETARAHRLSPSERLRWVVLPGAAPRIMAGMRTSLSMAVILMVISEMVGAVDGIGFELVQAQRTFRSLDVWAAIVVLGLVGWTLNGLLAGIERRLLRWQAPARGAAA